MSDQRKIYDALHGFIRLDPIETELVSSRAFQRLHGIHQLGIAYLVYPGATHSRFEHSLGVMTIASEIYDHFMEKMAKELNVKDIAGYRGIELLRRELKDEVEFITIMTFDSIEIVSNHFVERKIIFQSRIITRNHAVIN